MGVDDVTADPSYNVGDVVHGLRYWESMTAKELLEEQLTELAETDDLKSTMSNLDSWARSLRAKVLPDKE